MLKIQEEFYQWREVSCSAFSRSPFLDWQTKLIISSLLLEQRISDVVAPVIVKIANILEKIKNDSTFYSPPFYTHCFGYRACLLVTPNGIKECKNNQITVGICILKGPNDAKLSWPFRGRFTIT